MRRLVAGGLLASSLLAIASGSMIAQAATTTIAVSPTQIEFIGPEGLAATRQVRIAITGGGNVTLKLEYFSSDLEPFTPGLKLELLNQARTNTAPANAAMVAVSAGKFFARDVMG